MTTSRQTEMAERKTVLANDKKQSEASTFFEQAKLSEQLDGSRSKSSVTGAKPYDVPAIPSGPWSSGWCPPMIEEPLGFSVDEVPVCGAPHEIAASIAALDAEQAAAELAAPTAPSVSERPFSGVADVEMGAASQAKRLRIRRIAP
jgi:hypothetical protein